MKNKFNKKDHTVAIVSILIISIILNILFTVTKEISITVY